MKQSSYKKTDNPSSKNLTPNTLEERIELLLEKVDTSPISIGEVLDILSGKGQSLILILLCLPFCQPIQIPGLSTPFGLVIAFVGLRMAFGKHAWLPQRIISTKITASTLQKMADSTLWFIRKARFFIHPRLEWMCQHFAMKKINGIMIAALGIFLALPLPIPLSNVIAAWSIFLIGLGILEDDGLFVMMGYAVAFVALVALVLILFQIKILFSQI